jgi:DNA-binding NarL/FixJ family response regulator
MVGRLLRVLLVDDHEVVRHGIRALLEAHEDVTIVAEAESVPAAVAAVDQYRPDVVGMDVRLSDGSGIEATREIRARHPEARVLMLTSFADHEALFSSIMAGASGYVLKQIRGNELVSAVRSVGEGQDLIDPALTGVVMERLRWLAGLRRQHISPVAPPGWEISRAVTGRSLWSRSLHCRS